MLEWNKLDPEVRESPSVSVFKKKLLLQIRPSHNSTYGIHNPKGISYLTQLKVGLSKLNYHKFKHNFLDSIGPMCSAHDGIEDTEHFVLLCHSFEENRRNLLAGANEILKAHGKAEGLNENILQNPPIW